jgi:pteridine reductase
MAEPALGPRGERAVALVTGAARRVGLASAKALARAGCDLVITYLQRGEEAMRAADELNRLGATVRAEKLDLNDLPGADARARRLARELPRLDILVHNASVYAPTPLAQLTPEHLLENFRVHAAGPALLTRHLAPLLAQSPLPGGGAIVCMCDIHALGRPRREYLAYSMSKAALAEMVRSLAVELAPRVRVNGVAPGAVAFADSGPDADPEMQRRYLSRVPLARSGTPEEAAEVVRWLALDASYLTGEIVRVDGGRWLR